MFAQVLHPFIVFTWVLTAFVCSVVEGQVKVTGEPQSIRVHVGSDVTLPCKCDRPVDLTPLTVEWSRTDRLPHPSDPLKRVNFVHLYIHYHNDDPDMKLEEFVNRTQLSTEELVRGVASLKILHVSLADAGTYKCHIPNLKARGSQPWTLVTLIVEDPDTTTAPPSTPDLNHPQDLDLVPTNRDPTNPTNPTERSHIIALVLVPVLLLGMVVCFLLCKKLGREPEKKVQLLHI